MQHGGIRSIGKHQPRLRVRHHACQTGGWCAGCQRSHHHAGTQRAQKHGSVFNRHRRADGNAVADLHAITLQRRCDAVHQRVQGAIVQLSFPFNQRAASWLVRRVLANQIGDKGKFCFG